MEERRLEMLFCKTRNYFYFLTLFVNIYRLFMQTACALLYLHYILIIYYIYGNLKKISLIHFDSSQVSQFRMLETTFRPFSFFKFHFTCAFYYLQSILSKFTHIALYNCCQKHLKRHQKLIKYNKIISLKLKKNVH